MFSNEWMFNSLFFWVSPSYEFAIDEVPLEHVHVEDV